jgi:hypothetical protein
VRLLGLRFLRVLSVAVLAYAAILGANALGVPKLGWSLALVLFAGYLAYSLAQARKRAALRRELAWENAIYDAPKRLLAIAELEHALRKLEPVRPRSRQKHARLAVLLAELLDAQGEYQSAMHVIDRVPLAALSGLDVGLVRHTRAVIHLRAGDATGALQALSQREPSGDAELDQRLNLLEAYAQIEGGEAKRGMQQAEEISHLTNVDESVLTEARVVRAAGLDALGRREEALVVLAALGRDSLLPLSELGQPRVRALAQQILEGLSDA